jgi:uncharacterized protein YdhG (YjbR/CyaY superfamily)
VIPEAFERNRIRWAKRALVTIQKQTESTSGQPRVSHDDPAYFAAGWSCIEPGIKEQDPTYPLVSSLLGSTQSKSFLMKVFGQDRSAKGETPVKNPETIDAYLAGVADDEQRAALEHLRQTIRSILPDAEECISYRIPAFRLDGQIVAGFCARKTACSYFPFSGSTLRSLKRDLKDYEQTKSALHFDTDSPLPKSLVRKLLKARRAEMEE